MPEQARKLLIYFDRSCLLLLNIDPYEPSHPSGLRPGPIQQWQQETWRLHCEAGVEVLEQCKESVRVEYTHTISAAVNLSHDTRSSGSSVIVPNDAAAVLCVIN